MAGFFNDLIGGLTGQSQVDEAKRQAQSQAAFQQEVFDLIRQLFDQGLSAVSAARGTGAFDPAKIRESVQRNVDNLIANIATKGIVEGAQRGDTVQLENVAQGVITGSKALADVDFTALMRELSALGSVPTGGLVGQAGQVGATSAFGQQGIIQAQSAQNQRLGLLANVGFQFLRKPQKPQFGDESAAQAA